MTDPICPECDLDKCRNCDGRALDYAADKIVECACTCHEKRGQQ